MIITWGSFIDNQVNLQEVFDFLKDKLKELQYLLVSKEISQNGKIHLHGFITFNNKKDIKDIRAFFKLPQQLQQSLEERKKQSQIWIEKSITLREDNAINYFKKDGEFLEWGEQPNARGRNFFYSKLNQQKNKKQITQGELLEVHPDDTDNLPLYLAKDYYTLKKHTEISRTPKDPKQRPFEHNLYEWQQQLLDELNQDAPQKIVVWYNDSEGNSGKSSLAIHLFLNHPSKCLYMDISKKADMNYLIRPQHEWIFIDISRAQQENIEHVYPFVERLKDGIIFSSKYESELVKLFKIPHVIILANFKPNEQLLSRDRWVIRDLDKLDIPQRKANNQWQKKYNQNFEALIKKQPAQIFQKKEIN